MLRFVVLVLLIAAAHFSLIPFAPAPAGKAWLVWPLAADARPWLGGLGGLPAQGGSIVTPALAGLAALCFVAAALALFGLLVPAAWWPWLVALGAASSALMYVLYIGPWAILPLALDLLLLWGVYGLHWTVLSLRGA
jgi:hypothetical protein